MKNTFIQFLIFTSLLSSVLHANDFLPDEDDVATNLQEFNSVSNSNVKTNTESFMGIDSNTSTEKVLQKTDINITKNNFGNDEVSKKIDAFKVEDLKGYSDSIKKNFGAKGNALFQKLSVKVGGVDVNNKESLKQNSIINADSNSSEAKAIKFNQDFYTKVRSLMANLKTVECFVTRKLVNSYYCPLPSLNNSFFKGGSFKDSKEEAKKACENLCTEPVTCLSKDMGKPLSKVEAKTDEINNDTIVYVNSDIEMLGEYIELSFDSKYKYDDDIEIDSVDYNATKASEALAKMNHGVKINLDYMDRNGTYIPLLEGLDVKIDDINTSCKIYLTAIRSSKFKITFYDTYLLDKRGDFIKNDKLTSVLSKLNLKYIGNKWWFCPEINIISNAAKCSGVIKQVVIGSQTYNVCVTESFQKREPVYGAFYSQMECEASCKLTEDCVPTYKHLSNLDPYNLDSSLKDIEIGCVDNPANTSCSKELCTQMFIEDSMPLTEKTWTNDDKIKVTVSSGIAVEGQKRPRIDVEGGLSANGDEEARSLTSIKEMSEISYGNMLDAETYDISKYIVDTNIPFRNSYETVDNAGSYSLLWNLRPNSFDVDDGSKYYFYSVIDIESIFKPFYGSYTTSTGIQSATTDVNIRVLDKTFLLKTETGYKIIKKIQNHAGRFLFKDTNTSYYQWTEMTAHKKDNFETYNGVEFQSYDVNTPALHFKHQELLSDNKWETSLLFSSIEEMSTTPGVLFKTQQSIGQGASFSRIYDAALSEDKASKLKGFTVYGIYSKKQLSYKELINLISKSPNATSLKTNKYAIYSTKVALNKLIINDGSYDTTKVKMYVSGTPDKMSVNVDFSPDGNEEGKKTFIYMLLFDKN